jgi:hypothetical protein
MRGSGLVNDDDFGMPGPNVWYHVLLQKGWKEQARSDWLYYSKHPHKEAKGLAPAIPWESQLPLRIPIPDANPDPPPPTDMLPITEDSRPESPSGAVSLGSLTPPTPRSIHMKSPDPPTLHSAKVTTADLHCNDAPCPLIVMASPERPPEPEESHNPETEKSIPDIEQTPSVIPRCIEPCPSPES